MNIILAEKKHAKQIAAIHQQEIGRGFLASLGKGFLSAFYEAIIISPYSFCVIMEEYGIVTGFASSVTDMKLFYSYFFRNYFLRAAWALVPKLANIKTLKKIFQNLLYPAKTQNLPKAELLSIAVKKEFQGQGIGSKLLDECRRQFGKKNIKEFKVLVGKSLPSVAFYQKQGFTMKGELHLHEESSIIFTHTT